MDSIFFRIVTPTINMIYRNYHKDEEIKCDKCGYYPISGSNRVGEYSVVAYKKTFAECNNNIPSFLRKENLMNLCKVNSCHINYKFLWDIYIGDLRTTINNITCDGEATNT